MKKPSASSNRQGTGLRAVAAPSSSISSGSPELAEWVPIVAFGASAGGVEAMRQVLAQLPDDTGLAFVVTQHLDPNGLSMLASVLAGSKLTERLYSNQIVGIWY